MSETFMEEQIDDSMQYVEEYEQEETANLSSEDFEVGSRSFLLIVYDLHYYYY